MDTSSSETLAPSGSPKFATGYRALTAALTTIACLGWILPYWNRFVGVSSAGMPSYVAEQILRGRVPYRDFFLIIPPLSLLKNTLLMQLLGPSIAAMRVEAILERAFLAGLVCWWLSRYFRPAACFVAVFFAMALFAGDSADALVSYHHDAALLAVAAAFCASLFLKRSSRNAWLMAILSGVYAGMTFMTAQTVGAAITICLPATICALEWRSRRFSTARSFLAGYCLGWLIPTGLILIWLCYQHALPQFFQCVFLSGSAKGSAIVVFARPLWAQRYWVERIAVVLIAAGWWMHWKPRPPATATRRELAAVMAAAAIAIAAAWHAANHRFPVNAFGMIATPIMAAALVGAILATLYYLWRFWRPGSHSDDAGLTLLAAAGVAVGYSLSLSFAYYGPMVMPGLALVAAIILDRAWSYRPARLLAAGLCFLVVFLAATYKYETPFDWMYWVERSSPGVVHRSSYPELAGLETSEPTGAVVDHVADLIRQNAPAGGTLFVYPYLPLFNVLAGMSQPTYGFLHYLDVAPDALCRRDAQTLLDHPPSVIVRLMVDEEALRWDEDYFRGNRPSGTRRITEAMDKLSGGYRLIETVKVPGRGLDLRILVRK